MEEKKKQLTSREKTALIIMVIAIVFGLAFGISYAYFLAQGQSSEQTITTQNIGLAFDDGTAIVNATEIEPILREDILTKATKKTFTVINSGDEKMFVHITLDDITIPTALKRYDFMWSLYEGDKNVSNGTFADATSTTIDIAPYQVFEIGATKTYNLYIWIEETYLNQNTMMGQTFKAKITATGEVYYTSPESDFTVDSNGALTKYTGSDTNVIIPETVGGITVTSILDAFIDVDDANTVSGKNISNIVIPNSVTSIGWRSFMNNQLTSVAIPNSVTSINGFAFYGNQLKNIIFPDSVTMIGSDAFQNNQLTNLVLPNKLSEMSLWAFNNNQLTNLIIPSSVTTIGESVFGLNPNLKEIIVQGKSSLSEFTDSTGLTVDGGLPEGATITFEP